VISTVTLIDPAVTLSVNRMLSRTPAVSLSGICKTGTEACRYVWLVVLPPASRRASATAAAASTRPWPNQGLQDPSASPLSTNTPRSKGATGETSQVGLGS
jgi:hypothetical protein